MGLVISPRFASAESCYLHKAHPALTMNGEVKNAELADVTGEYAEELDGGDPNLEGTLGPKTYKTLERRIRLKLDIQLVPLCLLLYFLSFLDRTNIAQAMATKMQEDLSLSEHDYSIALTVLYPLYIVLEIPSNLILRFIGPRIWISLLVTCWGIGAFGCWRRGALTALVATLQGIVQSKYGLYINRIFLGVTEAGILPGIAVYLTDFVCGHLPPCVRPLTRAVPSPRNSTSPSAVFHRCIAERCLLGSAGHRDRQYGL